MKRALFAATLIALALSACTKKDEPVALPPPATAPSLVTPAPTPTQNDSNATPATPSSEPASSTPASSDKPAN
ncbi:MAG: hypothetical protein LWW81_01050 [Rhodocyclales bacterium]|nr:hypothetical protein [Rhodocyclales bacterium]